MTPPEDPEIEAYRARLKQRTPIRVSPLLVLVIAAPLVGLAGAAFVASRAKGDAEPTPPSVSSPPPPPTPADRVKTALQSVADTYAPMDATSVESAPVALARGRKVTFVQQSRGFDPDTARLLNTSARSPMKVVMLPEGFEPGAAGALAVDPKDVGVVVLVNETMNRVGTYTGGKEPAVELEYDALVVLVPEAKRIARFTHVAAAPPVATRLGTGKDSVLVGGLTHDDGSWMRDAAVALHDGRAP